MIQLQLISKVLNTQDFSIVENNLITEEYFVGYENEFNFIKDHYNTYGNVPDKATFLAKFPSVELVEVTETDDYIINTLREEHLYYNSIPVIQKAAEYLKSDANKAAEYLMNELPKLQPSYQIKGVDIINQADLRLAEYEDRKNHKEDWFITTGFEELDEIIYGLQRGEEYVVIFARTNHGKSWMLAKICTHINSIGFNVGYVSPEMSANSIGFRFDTLNSHFSNRDMIRGNEIDGYEEYLENLKNNNAKFIVSTPSDFDKKITVSKLRNYIKQYKLDVLAIDGITYLTDERYKRGDNKTTTLTNISEDLMSLSVEMKIPILVVVQSNRQGVMDKSSDGTPELENIKDSDGISANATKVISLRQSESGLELGIKKNRSGRVGDRLLYDWDIDTGRFTNIPVNGDSRRKSDDVEAMRKGFTQKDKEDVF